MIDFFAGNLHELTEKLAYEYWERRGRPLGSPEIDWSAAERALATYRKRPETEFLLYSLPPEPYEGPYRGDGESGAETAEPVSRAEA
jgi:Protein of unknown function (DUF2934)